MHAKGAGVLCGLGSGHRDRLVPSDHSDGLIASMTFRITPEALTEP